MAKKALKRKRREAEKIEQEEKKVEVPAVTRFSDEPVAKKVSGLQFWFLFTVLK